MTRGPFLAALVAGAVATLVADAADAAVRPKPEALSFKAGTVVFRRNKAGTQGSPEADLIIVPQETQFGLRATFEARNKKGIITRRSLALRMAPTGDPREAGSVPAVYRAGSGLSGTYTLQTSTDEDPVGTTKTWTVDERGAIPFTVRWKRYDPVTSRLTGTFAGQMASGVVGVRGLRIAGGTFAADVRFQELEPPPLKR